MDNVAVFEGNNQYIPCDINTKKYIETYLKIVDKNSNTIPFQLNKAQQRLYDVIADCYRKKKPIRIIILKARQLGFSTLTEGIFFKRAVTEFNFKVGIITHSEEATNNLFNMSKKYYDELPNVLKPCKKMDNSKGLTFNTPDGKGLNSSIRCMTAGAVEVGRGSTFNALHISELPMWKCNKQDVLSGLLQSVPNTPESMIIIESTAKGFDEFKQIWDKAVLGENGYVPIFFPWYEMPEYQDEYFGEALTENELIIKEKYQLTNEQMMWRRHKIDSPDFGGSEQLFNQEYPDCPENAFISTGSCFFTQEGQEKIIDRMKYIPYPIMRGEFDYKELSKTELSDIELTKSSNGPLLIYKEPVEGHPYVMGVDTAGEGSDFFVAHVIDNHTKEQVAVFRCQMDERWFVKQIYCLGKYYNEAMIGVETNFSTYVNNKLSEDYEYYPLYVRKQVDSRTNREQDSFGFRTSSKSRPLILDELKDIVLHDIELINDKATLMEMLTFVKNDKGRPEAIKGCHDDCVMSLAITFYIAHDYETIISKAKEKEKKLPNNVFGDDEDTNMEGRIILWD